MNCYVCEIEPAAGRCVDCAKTICKSCATPCQRCRKLICPAHVQVTPHGRNLCGACMKARNEAREKRLRQLEQQRKTSQPDRPTPRPTPVSTPGGGAREEMPEALSFEALMAGDPALPKMRIPDEPREAEDKETHAPARPRGEEFEELSEEEKSRQRRAKTLADLEQMPERQSRSLEIDENRPILTKSTERPPGYWRYALALIFFLGAFVFMYRRLPSLQPVLLLGLLAAIGGFAIWAVRLYHDRKTSL